MGDEAGQELWIYRIGGVSAILGAILGLVGNLIHPVTPGPGDPAGTAHVVAASQIWIPVHLGLGLAFVLMLGGLVAIQRSIVGGLAGALAQFGLAAGIVGATVGVVIVTLDGFASKHLAELYVAPAGGPHIDLGPFQAEEAINFALLSPLNLVFAGVTFILYGAAAALSGRFPGWLGWVVGLAGLGGAVSGVIQAYMGEPIPATRALGIAAPTIITLWLLVMGILLLRQRRNPARS
jgi:hypothetical protein